MILVMLRRFISNGGYKALHLGEHIKVCVLSES